MLTMEREAFEALVDEALAALPDDFRGRLANVAIAVEDWADRETLRAAVLAVLAVLASLRAACGRLRAAPRGTALRAASPCSLRVLDPSCAPWRGGRARARAKEVTMLRIYETARQALRGVGELATRVAKHDADLARQLRRAGTSIVLNIREGSQSQGGNRNARYWNAAGSANEVLGCIDCAEALGYVAQNNTELRASLGAVVGTMVRIVRVQQ